MPQASLLDSVDVTDLHGGLLALTEISIAYRQSEKDVEQLEDRLRNVNSFTEAWPDFIDCVIDLWLPRSNP